MAEVIRAFSTAEHPMRDTFSLRPLRWFLLVWVGLVLLWGLASLWGVNAKTLRLAILCQDATLPGNACIPPVAPTTAFAFTLVFVPLALLLGGLLWRGLKGIMPQRLALLSLFVQGGLVLLLGLLVQQENILFSLYLALALAAIALLRRIRPIGAVVTTYLAMFLLSCLMNTGGGTWESWKVFLATFGSTTDYLALSLFVAGYLVIYVQQARTHDQLEHAHRNLETAHAQLNAAASQIAALTRLTERQRLARELHDTLAQGLVGLTLQLETVDGLLTLERPRQAQDIVQQAMAHTRATLTQARSAIDDLRAESVTALDLTEAVEEEIGRFRATTGIACSADLTALPTLPQALHEPLLRVIAEGLMNVARHARASQVRIGVVQTEGSIRLDLQDDGVGFDPTTVADTGHYGLLGLRERARLTGGQLAIISHPGEGTRLCLTLPLDEKALGAPLVSASGTLFSTKESAVLP